ncbi:competence type IV pilus major pilin ComGC [Bythopirellula goksoeyrii]|uniref:Fimbrial protein n=1 Tax=Bythopirellula goksoeyrii TaxID=1400387 RepID=A0A5B9QD21_9BACT|nr:type II secretion system protein [Bythopirellula goksoeyrii]QEG35515.1 Fimbrial protein precursor [Bythopirellula goksoeyrii]
MKSIKKWSGFSLLEVLAVATMVGILAAIVIPRFTGSNDIAKYRVRDHYRTTINKAVEEWYIAKGKWPLNDLSDIGADPNYLPEGIPINPVDNKKFSLNATTHRVN